MKRVLLLGDSIRQNYDEYVANKIKNIADVRYCNENGRFCQYTLRYMHEWFYKFDIEIEKNIFDVVHFNCGLWDVLRLKDDDGQLTPPEFYESLLRRIFQRIRKLCPNAVIIFALTTPVIEPGFAQGTEIGVRCNSDIELYNKLAIKVLVPLGAVINDLWSVAKEIQDIAHSDDVHFDTKEGIKALGDAVIRSLEPYL